MSDIKEISSFLQGDQIKKRFSEILGKSGPSFVSSVLSVVSNNKLLSTASKDSIYNAALVAATLNLSVNPNIGAAYIVPYKGNAQFQMGYRGYIQLAHRTDKYAAIGACKVLDGQLIDDNPLLGPSFDFNAVGNGNVIGYAAFFKLTNGFTKAIYWPLEKVKNHASRFSKSYKSGPWNTDFDEMANKTVLKNLLSKYGVMSTDMNTAIVADQAVIDDFDSMNVTYPDNPNSIPEKAVVVDDPSSAINKLKQCKTEKEIESIFMGLSGEEQRHHDVLSTKNDLLELIKEG